MDVSLMRKSADSPREPGRRRVDARGCAKPGHGCGAFVHLKCLQRSVHAFDHVERRAQVGDVEEWTVRNVTGEHHVFHVHQTDFLVTSTNGSRSDMLRVLDTINVPFASNGTPGQVTLIVPLLRDRIAGRFVYHCHILEHEDGGMMANILVQPRSGP